MTAPSRCARCRSSAIFLPMCRRPQPGSPSCSPAGAAWHEPVGSPACAGGLKMVSWVAVKATDTHRAIEAVWRIESPRLIAGLMRSVRDVGVAEDLAQDALVGALEQGAESGIPGDPG